MLRQAVCTSQHMQRQRMHAHRDADGVKHGALICLILAADARCLKLSACCCVSKIYARNCLLAALLAASTLQTVCLPHHWWHLCCLIATNLSLLLLTYRTVPALPSQGPQLHCFCVVEGCPRHLSTLCKSQHLHADTAVLEAWIWLCCKIDIYDTYNTDI